MCIFKSRYRTTMVSKMPTAQTLSKVPTAVSLSAVISVSGLYLLLLIVVLGNFIPIAGRVWGG